MTEEPGDAYDRGVVAGEIAARLAGHDRHFESINGSLAKVADEMHGLKLAVQRLGDQAEANQSTVLTTAAALKDAEEARRSTADQAWSPVQKLIAVIGGVAAAATIVAVIVAVVVK